jgi:hypothetical protein
VEMFAIINGLAYCETPLRVFAWALCVKTIASQSTTWHLTSKHSGQST